LRTGEPCWTRTSDPLLKGPAPNPILPRTTPDQSLACVPGRAPGGVPQAY